MLDPREVRREKVDEALTEACGLISHYGLTPAETAMVATVLIKMCHPNQVEAIIRARNPKPVSQFMNELLDAEINRFESLKRIAEGMHA